MTKSKKSVVWEDVPSPFCGIGADDIQIKVDGDVVTVESNGCAVNTPAFEFRLSDKKPRIGGEPATIKEAAAKIAEIIKAAHLPLIGGCATDVNGMRALLSLADHSGAAIDNMNFNGARRNILSMQDNGWINTTLAEVKNRVDLLLVVGTDVEPLFPRFFERYIWNKESMFIQDTAKREVVCLGKAPSCGGVRSPDGSAPEVLVCDDADLPEVVALLRAIVNGVPVAVESVGGIPVAELRNLAERLKKASYPVVTWAAGDLDFPQAELTVEMVCELVKDLNNETRCSGLPLGGREGDQTANQVCGWQTGYPARVRFSSGFPEYDPHYFSADRLLGNGEADALLWVSAFNGKATPPQTDVPTVVIGRSGMTFEQEPDVFVPIGTPGIDHAGHAYRMDNVVAIRLKKLRDSGLPSTADVLKAVEQAL
ncbi:MAG: formylmethanofuran dehydrogenase subunit B [Methylococcales bacterium]